MTSIARGALPLAASMSLDSPARGLAKSIVCVVNGTVFVVGATHTVQLRVTKLKCGAFVPVLGWMWMS